MHEVTLAAELVAAVEAHAAANRLARVVRVYLEIGALAAVEVDALRLAFEVARAGGVAAEAELVVEERPGQAHCLGCGATVTVESRLDACPACGGVRLRVTSGDALRLTGIEGVEAGPG